MKFSMMKSQVIGPPSKKGRRKEQRKAIGAMEPFLERKKSGKRKLRGRRSELSMKWLRLERECSGCVFSVRCLEMPCIFLTIPGVNGKKGLRCYKDKPQPFLLQILNSICSFQLQCDAGL